MSFHFQIARLVPRGMIVEQVVEEGEDLVVTAHVQALAAACPLCGEDSRRIHSRYLRQVADLPCAGRKVRLHIVARRFVCEAPQCLRRIFAERFEKDVLASRSRRTARLECIVHHLGLALGGRFGEAPDAAGQQRYASTGGTPAGLPLFPDIEGCRGR